MIDPTTISVELTPEQVAQAFVALRGSDSQAEFFGHVKRLSGNLWAERQWMFMCGHLEGEDGLVPIDPTLARDGKDVLMSMAAPLYLHTLNFIERNNQ